ncbi:MAG TPA: hypothetical protein VI565_09675, partial [Burkholderiales bacterium]|nr:hypothetical protein [Burkholderiales bacterium]
MIGARLFLQTENQPRGARWRDALRARSRAVRFYDRYPGVEIQLGADGYVDAHPSHLERMRRRELLNLGSVSLDLDKAVYADPDRFPTEDLKYTCDSMLDTWRVYLDRAASVAGFDSHGWGSVFPRVVFVGDRYSGNRAAARPFSNPMGSCATLSELLNHAGVAERD